MQSGRQFEYEVVLNSELDSTRQFRIGLVRHLLMHVSLALQHLLDTPFVLHDLLPDS
jgi:hypothetical protein